MTARYTEAHNDMLGKLQSPQTGGTAWTIEAITGTTFIVGALNETNDVVQATIQVPHTRKLGSILDSIHIHYVLQGNSTAGDTITFTGKYVWIQPGDVIPADASWIAMTGAGLTLTLGTHLAGYYNIHAIQASISCPAGAAEGYGGMLLISITRTAPGTYGARLAILDVDAHTIVDRKGSANEATD